MSKQLGGRDGRAQLEFDEVFEVQLLPRNLKSAQADLENQDPKIRLKVVEELRRVSGEAERTPRVQLLQRALDDKNTEVRRQALLGLADLEAREATADVLALLRDVDVKVRQIAVLCLGEIADPEDAEIHQRLHGLLKAPEARIRYQAVSALCHLDGSSAASVIEISLTDDDAELRELSLRLVDEILLAEDVELPSNIEEKVRVACNDEDLGIRLVAQLLAGRLAWESPREMLLEVIRRRFKVRELRDEQDAIRLSGKLGMRDALPSLSRRALGWFGFSLDPFRWVALGAMVRLGDLQAFRKLAASLNSRRLSDRTMAVQILAETGDLRAQPLLEALRGQDARVDQELLSNALETLKEELNNHGGP